ncbi:leucine Rich Repeat [Seminavis robusta]|uniref:Leucine Rich Repeat n=1 Tax=Seminavis robusta TaxID=568900 RepID=A0A9N8DWR0_9STRA|nr:leucine Rich Repeat [Seminavis robusta]|eukprot:Sro338_g120920.1 leucine Rich Repeat (472) ;mRNA; r:63127-64741
MAPTTTRDVVEAPKIEIALTIILGRDYLEHVAEETGNDYLDDKLAEFLLETRRKALDWIVNQDPLQLRYDSPNLVQRFLLVLFYYQTTRHKPWKECNPAASPQPSATSGFCYEPAFYTGEATSNIWGDQWLSASHECQWAGITCETVQSVDRTVAELRLFRNDLNGPLPWEITRLPQLRILGLSSNMLTGVLPPRLLSKRAGVALKSLDLSWNQFSGTIPTQWVPSFLEGNGKLTSLRLQRNTLTGRIPSELGLLPLKDIILTRNTLTGSIPQEILNQTSLRRLYLGKNDLTGTFPSEIGLLTNLEYLYLNHTHMSGSLPSEIGLANQLLEMILSNTNMQGTLPKELYTGLNKLEFLYLDGCNFTGTISPSLGLLTHLISLDVSNNHFHGTIPNEIVALTNLAQLVVNGNQITGTIPISFCRNLAYLEHGRFEVAFVADCLPSTETGVPAIQCASDCCTVCCDQTGVCLST